MEYLGAKKTTPLCDAVFLLMRHRGFEPRTTWLKVKCSTDWANIPYSFFTFYIWRWSDRFFGLPIGIPQTEPYRFHSKCPEPESNQRHRDFQSLALPTELSGHELRELDLNQRPSGYEPDELPDCSIPRWYLIFSPSHAFRILEKNWMEKDSNLRKRR